MAPEAAVTSHETVLDRRRRAAAGLSSRSIPVALLGPRLAAVGVPAVAVCALALAGGGYFPVAWGFAALGLLWVAATTVLAGHAVRLGRLGGALACGLALLAGWAVLSSVWSGSTTAPPLEAQRDLVYVAGVLAVLLVGRRQTVGHVLAGVLVATVAVSAYALATRLFPERLGHFDPVAGYRLAAPLGYWNALGAFCALGTVLAVGFSARARTHAGRAFAAASLVVLVPTLYFTFGRGAWIALGAGLVAALAVEPRRSQLLAAVCVAAPAPAIAVLLAVGSPALTREQSSLAAAGRGGHRLALALLGLGLAAAAMTLAADFVAPRLKVPRLGRRACTVALILAIGTGAAAEIVAAGGPVTLVQRGYSAFTAPPPRIDGSLNARLFSFSGNGRMELWRSAWRDYNAHAWLGSGAGSFERWWLRDRPTPLTVRDAHSLYLETLAELGPIGLALLVLALGAPVVAAVRARRHPFVPIALGAYVTYLVHAAADWDWEMPALTLAALLCGAACIVAARSDEFPGLSRRRRGALVAATVSLGLAAFVGLAGATSLTKSREATRSGQWARAEGGARNAIRWAPWSTETWRQLGEAQLGRGDLAAARRSFRHALALDRGDWSLWFDLARAASGRAQQQTLAEAAVLDPLAPEIAEFRRELAAQSLIEVAAR
jgi:hypothetical protein